MNFIILTYFIIFYDGSSYFTHTSSYFTNLDVFCISCIQQIFTTCWAKNNHREDERNPAPIDMVKIPLFSGFDTSQVVSRISSINSITPFFHTSFLKEFPLQDIFPATEKTAPSLTRKGSLKALGPALPLNLRGHFPTSKTFERKKNEKIESITHYSKELRRIQTNWLVFLFQHEGVFFGDSVLPPKEGWNEFWTLNRWPLLRDRSYPLPEIKGL